MLQAANKGRFSERKMSILGLPEQLFSEVIYANRLVFAPLAAAALVGAVFAGYRLGVFRWVAGHRNAALAVGIPAVIVGGIAGYYLASPLWERSELIETSPLAADSGMTATPMATSTTTALASVTSTAVPTAASPVAFVPRVVQRGEWKGADEFHFARGNALLIESAPGEYVVRVEEFSVRNGPDLFVYLSPSAEGYADGALNLGGLKATDGAFNYEVPAGTDISQFQSVVVWCRAFTTLFGTATLAAAM